MENKLRFKVIIVLFLLSMTVVNAQVAPPANAVEIKSSCLGGDSFWVADDDEPGLYTNQTNSADFTDGTNNTGGVANATCRAKGAGWYLPSVTELLRMYSAFRQGYLGSFDDINHVTYWSSTGSALSAAFYVSFFHGPSHDALKTDANLVRCCWRRP